MKINNSKQINGDRVVLTKPETEEQILAKLQKRRKRNGTPSYAMPDYYELITCANAGIDIDFSPADYGEPPGALVREGLAGYESLGRNGTP